MSHYEVTVVYDIRATRTQRARARKRVGGIGLEYAKAERLSCVPWVERVVITCVQETHVGTWEKGKYR